MSRPSRRRSVFAAGLLLLASSAAAALEVPYLSGRVVDQAGMLTPEAAAEITTHLEQIETSTGAQVAVLLIPTLDDEVLEEYSLRVAMTWKLGRGKFDDGALLLVARDDRKMRLEVGYGLEPILTDAISRRILDDVMRPHFRAGDFAGGVGSAVDAIGGLLEGNDVLPPPAEATGGGRPEMAWPARLGIFAFVCFILGIFSFQAVISQGCAAWFLYLFLIPFWGLFPPALLGPRPGLFFVVGWLVGFPIVHLLLPKKLRVAASKRFGGTHWSSGGRGGFSSGGFSSGGFSGGGFSGGGGSFGGGGASSSW